MLTPRSAKALQEKVLLKVLLCLVLVFDGKTYDLPINPNDQPNDSETPINFDSDDEPTPQPKPKEPKLVKETPSQRNNISLTP
ncbi:hypothetical protein Tco_0757205 [Tanacetum coccineum]